jgi:hypothetical protein
MAVSAESIIRGHRRKADVPLTPGTSARVCGKCDLWFPAASRQRVCDACIPAYRRTLRAIGDQGKCITKNRVYLNTTHPEMVMQTASSEGSPEPGGAFSYADLCRLWARRTGKLMRWMEATGRPLREYPDYPMALP